VVVRDYDIINASDPLRPLTMATIRGVKQQVERESSGMLFLLGNSGLTNARRLRVEEDSREASN